MEEVSRGSFSDYPDSLDDRDEILEDIRETLRESVAEALSVGKALLDQLRYPITEFTEAVDAGGVIEEFENLVDAMKTRQQGIDSVVKRFGEILDKRDSGTAVGPVENYVVSETPLMVEVEVFEKEVPVQFASEKMDGKALKEESKIEEGVRDNLISYFLFVELDLVICLQSIFGAPKSY